MKSIFITGAAAGIGRATAQRFAAEGWFVGLADLDASALRALQGELGAGRCSVHVMDVADLASVRDALQAFGTHTGGRLQVLHNNAGVLKAGSFEEIDPAVHRRIVEVNVIGVMNVLHAAFPLLRATPGAVVVNMSSISAAYGTPDFASYSASKHAVRALTEALDIEWEQHGIRVCDLMPPFVDTGMVQAQGAVSPIIHRLGVNLQPEDVATAVWDIVKAPALHRPVTLRFRALWPVARAVPATVTRTLLKALAGR